MSELLDAFYDESAEAIWNHGGLLNKTMGDAVMALFNFPIRQDDHPRQAVLAAREIQERCKKRRRDLARPGSIDNDAICVGVGIDCGDVQFGEFGRTHRDLTAIGTVVNRAARAQAAAESGEILVTKAVYDRASTELGRSAPLNYSLKGFDESITLWAA